MVDHSRTVAFQRRLPALRRLCQYSLPLEVPLKDGRIAVSETVARAELYKKSVALAFQQKHHEKVLEYLRMRACEIRAAETYEQCAYVLRIALHEIPESEEIIKPGDDRVLRTYIHGACLTCWDLEDNRHTRQ